jgi:hypothetical protein
LVAMGLTCLMAAVEGGCVPDGSFGWPSRDRDGLVRSAIRTWRDGLINLTGSSRLLNFKPGRTSVISVARPAPQRCCPGWPGVGFTASGHCSHAPRSR